MRAGDFDQGVYFYDRYGREVVHFWLPGRIVAATRCRFASGAWIILDTPAGPQVMRVARSGQVMAPQPITRLLHRLIGARGWLCGLDETNTLYVLDPSTSAMAPVPVLGQVIDYEHGMEEAHLYVLEERDAVLRYASVFTVEPIMTTQGVAPYTPRS